MKVENLGKKEGGKKASRVIRKRVRVHLWLRWFYNGPYYYSRFPFLGEVVDTRREVSYQTKHDYPAEWFTAHRPGPNPLHLDPMTHLAAYLAYWLCTFAVPTGDESLIRPETIYPACQLAWGIKLAICPVSLGLIYRTLGIVASSKTPRECTTVGPLHFFNAWAGFMFPSLAVKTIASFTLFPKILEFAGATAEDMTAQLFNVRDSISNIPRGRDNLLFYIVRSQPSSS